MSTAELACAAVVIIVLPIGTWLLSRIVFSVYFQMKRQHTKNVLRDIESKPDSQ